MIHTGVYASPSQTITIAMKEAHALKRSDNLTLNQKNKSRRIWAAPPMVPDGLGLKGNGIIELRAEPISVFYHSTPKYEFVCTFAGLMD